MAREKTGLTLNLTSCVSCLSGSVGGVGRRLHAELVKKQEEYKDVIKIGRTHLQDAVPMTLGEPRGLHSRQPATVRR